VLEEVRMYCRAALVSEPAAFFTLVVMNSYSPPACRRLRAGRVERADAPEERVLDGPLVLDAFFLRSFIGSGPPYSFDAMSERVNPYGLRWIIV
jgi:hypothetical protein